MNRVIKVCAECKRSWETDKPFDNLCSSCVAKDKQEAGKLALQAAAIRYREVHHDNPKHYLKVLAKAAQDARANGVTERDVNDIIVREMLRNG